MKKSIWWLAALLCSSASLGWADSDKLKFSGNDHYYQRIDTAMSWSEANALCVAKAGHLATITSTEEQSFIVSNFVTPSSTKVYLGASDRAAEGTWRWITGETMSYTTWNTGEPDAAAGDSEDYLGISVTSSGQWSDVTNAQTDMFPLCEWTGMLVDYKEIPDTNGDGKKEIAYLYQILNGKVWVDIVNLQTEELIRSITFYNSSTNIMKKLDVLADISGNGKPELAVGMQPIGGSPKISVRDAVSGNPIKTLQPCDGCLMR